MKSTVYHLASRGELQRATEKERLLKVERVGKREIISKESIVLGKVTLVRGTGRVYQ